MLLGMLAFSCEASGAGYNVLYRFKAMPDAAYPYAPLIADHAGNFYGTASAGGSGNCSNDHLYGCGAVFELSADGTETVLHSFQGGSDGLAAYGALLSDKNGNLYGTTYYGGGDTSCYPIGCGTVFKIAPNGTETIVHAFQGSDGSFPVAGLVADKKGNLFGTASDGGNTGCFAQLGCGVVFKIAPDGSYTMLYVFTGQNGDGSNPSGRLFAGAKGDFYGTTDTGGDQSCSVGGNVGCGTVFKLMSDGTEKALYAFHGGSDGAHSTAGLVADAAGNFYGTTYYGGGTGCFENLGCGTVFKLSPDGSETVLYRFSGAQDGEWPHGGVILDRKGNLFGPAFVGGAHKRGILFELTSKGRLVVLHAFEGKAHEDGVDPYAGLLMDRAGNLFGTTVGGGKHDCGGYGCGTIFEIEQ